MMARRKRRKFTAEQKADAVRLVRETGNLTEVARNLDLTRSALDSWVRQADVDDGKGPAAALTSDEKAELARLRRQVRTLQMERDFLKKPRPSSPRNRIRLQADRRGEGQLPRRPDVSSALRVSQWFLQVAHSSEPVRSRT